MKVEWSLLAPISVPDVPFLRVCGVRTRAGVAGARAGQEWGPPPKLKVDDLKAAKALLAIPDIPVADVAKRIGVSVAKLYPHFPFGARDTGDAAKYVPGSAAPALHRPRKKQAALFLRSQQR